MLNDLKRKAPRSKNTRMNLVLFRLACCCGLRASEIAKLQVGDVRTGIGAAAHPHSQRRFERRTATHGSVLVGRGDVGRFAAWKADRVRSGADFNEPFLASLIPGRTAKTFSRHTLRKRFRTACKVLGAARLEGLTIHHGRHTFISHALAGERTLAEVRDAAGHANVSITSGYLHIAVDDETALEISLHDRGQHCRYGCLSARHPDALSAHSGLLHCVNASRC